MLGLELQLDLGSARVPHAADGASRSGCCLVIRSPATQAFVAEFAARCHTPKACAPIQPNHCGVVITSCVDPHRLGIAGARETAFAEKINCAPIGDHDVLMEALIMRHE